MGTLTPRSALAILASTPVAGFTKVNGTPNILTWTAPSDGNMHRVILIVSEFVTAAETGGQLGLTYTQPNGQVSTTTFLNAQAAGARQTEVNAAVQAGSTVTFGQNTALTAGGPTLVWADMIGV